VRIELHPKPDGMQHVNLMFCEEAPDPEDGWVREQLDRFPVPPKRVLYWEREGRQYRVWQYGECLIADPLFFIERYKCVVDRIRAVCRDELDRVGLERGRLNALISQTALEFHEEARFTVGRSGELAITLDEARLRERMLERLDAEPR
jgi:hypothetical protein